jgi:selenoprotein W-related protein
MAQELLTTFDDDHALQSITLIPSKEGDGRFFIRSHEADSSTLLWDRKANGGFPEMKQIKQIVRDQIDPERYLGHSDSETRQQHSSATLMEKKQETIECQSEEIVNIPKIYAAVEPHVSILYCTGCRRMLRAAYYGQELLYTFDDELKSVTLFPGRPPTPGGVFTVILNDDIIWDRKEQGRFPEVKELKQCVRDRLNPRKNLGHSDIKKQPDEATMDEDAAENSRKFFGVA